MRGRVTNHPGLQRLWGLLGDRTVSAKKGKLWINQGKFVTLEWGQRQLESGGSAKAVFWKIIRHSYRRKRPCPVILSFPGLWKADKELGQRAEVVVQQVIFCFLDYQIPSSTGKKRDSSLTEVSNPATPFPQREDEPGLVHDGWGLLALMGSSSCKAARLHDPREHHSHRRQLSLLGGRQDACQVLQNSEGCLPA